MQLFGEAAANRDEQGSENNGKRTAIRSHGRPGDAVWKWTSSNSWDWLSCSGANRFRLGGAAACAAATAVGSRRWYRNRLRASGSFSSHELSGEKWRKDLRASSSSFLSTSPDSTGETVSSGGDICTHNTVSLTCTHAKTSNGLARHVRAMGRQARRVVDARPHPRSHRRRRHHRQIAAAQCATAD